MILGRPFFDAITMLHFPGPENTYITSPTPDGDNLVNKLESIQARPDSDKPLRPCTHPCLIGNPKNNRKLKISPLLGSADDGLYMNMHDIQKLDLKDTGKEVQTRQGVCKVYAGVTFQFPDDHNEGQIKYHIPFVLGLPLHVTNSVHADASKNNKKAGIIGTPQMGKHLVIFHRSVTYIVDLSIVPSLSEYLANLSPLSSIKIGAQAIRESERHPDIQEPFDLDRCLSIASRASLPPFNPFLTLPTDIAIMGLADSCRVCQKHAEEEDTLKRCLLCRDEKRERMAVYCGKECQTKDWKDRHKAEHRGTVPWDNESIAPSPLRGIAIEM